MGELLEDGVLRVGVSGDMGSHDAKAECSQRFELDSNVTPSAQYLYSKRPIAVEIMLESASRTCSSRHVRRHRAMWSRPRELALLGWRLEFGDASSTPIAYQLNCIQRSHERGSDGVVAPIVVMSTF